MSYLKNILIRIEKAAEILDLEPWLLDKLRGFKMCWSCNLEVKMNDGTLKQFRAVRIWHRSPHTDQPHKGGLRYHPEVNEEMMMGHAIEMSIKCWLNGLEWGGAKGGVAIDPSCYSDQVMKNVTEALVDEMDERNILGPFRDVPATDVGTTSKTMNQIRQRYAQRRRSREDARFAGVVTGKPVGYGFGGIPGRNEATGYGLVEVLKSVMAVKNMNRQKFNRVAIMGFGNVGSNAAKFLTQNGYQVMAVSDKNGGIYNPKGFNIDFLERLKTDSGIINIPNIEKSADKISNDELLKLEDIDILVPAALENVITQKNASLIKAKIILEGANGPTTPEADKMLQDNGILVIPDILANAGGVTVSFFEWARNVNIKDERVPKPEINEVLKAMSAILNETVIKTVEKSFYYRKTGQDCLPLRMAAYITAIEQVAPLFRSKHMA
ncbi:MAG: Glu/Leu/Phe/Val dehydrogenase [Candidatus Brennerbacteria bacterium]|nr:Glu/Leu/Phe/Val dehydrogenase [Candidatus Brennerbacteria bacterium]